MCVNISRFLVLLASYIIRRDPLILLSIATSILALKSILAAQFMIILHVLVIIYSSLGDSPTPSLSKSPWLHHLHSYTGNTFLMMNSSNFVLWMARKRSKHWLLIIYFLNLSWRFDPYLALISTKILSTELRENRNF